MSILDDILDTLDLKGVFYFRTDFSPPWSVEVPNLGNAARFHLVVQGRCSVRFPTGELAELSPGDLILIPHGQSHILSCTGADKAPNMETVLADAGYDGNGVLVVGNGDPKASTQLICGHFSFRDGADHPVLRALPEFMHMTGADRAANNVLDEILRLIVRAVLSENLGLSATITRLSEVVFIELVRSGIGADKALETVLEGFTDRQIGKAIELIHKNTAEPWTVGKLASAVGMSRSRFAERFSELVSMGPVTYLSDWRLQKALSMLEDTRLSVQQVSAETGYKSPAAFTRAFSAKFGTSPSKFRKKSLEI